ncbi:hypothetical protein EJ06DRAFT_583086 [Trichodelitschia bisporula]|uniref:Uncharacterized protein n=1 Tax=Trichodelitschia bisporula TaxID=703511 RepID=A0A6G1HT78_9PEZI|nr:hypothetical protein EJ06DRAFT_583086 [Trichodelitschia bisporula]
MLAAWSYPTAYMPPRPSPLSPRSANNCTSPAYVMSKPIFDMGSSSRPENAPFAKRAIKANPLMRSRDDTKTRRRDMFMKKVERGRDDGRWEQRRDQILRSDYIAEQRRWEEERIRSAPVVSHEIYEDEDDLPVANQASNLAGSSVANAPESNMSPEDEAEAIARMEEEELKAYLELAEEKPLNDHFLQVPSSPTRYGSDEEDYNSLFNEFLATQNAQERCHELHTDEMDMS